MIRDMLTSPGSQKDPHHWAATFGGHAWIAIGPWGILAILFDMWTAAWVVPIIYFFVWEGLQWAFAPKRNCPLFWDGILDTVAVAFGCYAAACLGHGYQLAAVWCWGAAVAVMVTGWKVRE